MSNFVGKIISTFKEFYSEINPATLTGAIDVIVVKQADGSFKSSPFHVRFGKIGVLRYKEKIVDIEVNGEPIDIHMELTENGEATFIDGCLTSEQLTKLNLQFGANQAVFSITTAYQGTSRCMCNIYLWQHDDKIIVSDIDGTITRSDVLGQVLPILGKDWAQCGVARLYTRICENGYKFLYLSARAIGQSSITRDYLRSVKQDEIGLPDGPVILSPTSLLLAFHREVIEKKPEIFKIGCLGDIKGLFSSNPFFAGFGNKINDVCAYNSVDIPRERTFTIDHTGKLTLKLPQLYQSSYKYLIDVVDQVFPPVNKDNAVASSYGQFNYWRAPMVNIDPE